MSQTLGKYEVARRCLETLERTAAENGHAAEDCVEALIVVAIESMSQRVGRKRTADMLRYELSSIGGDVDTVFLRSR